jgi:hypothetical protein
MSSGLQCLNDNFRVIQYNGGPIYGQYGVSSAFRVEPGSATRATATRAGTTFDLVLEYVGEQKNFIFEQLVVISPKFEEVTAMLKAGVIWVHGDDSEFIQKDKDGQNVIDINYSQFFSDFHKTKILPKNSDSKNPSSSKISLPIPSAVFDYGSKKGPLTIAAADNVSVSTGKYIHIKFTDTFDDDYNIDFGHFYIIGRPQSESDRPNNNENNIPTYSNNITIEQRQWLLKNGIVSTPSSQTQHNVIFTPQNSSSFFEQTSSVFVSAKPIYQYLGYIEGKQHIDDLPQDEADLVKNFILFNNCADKFTTTWRGEFTSDLITANLQKETGTDMVKGNRSEKRDTKLLEMPTEMVFFTIDPTTPVQLRNVALGHIGELVLSSGGVDPRQIDAENSDDVNNHKINAGAVDLKLPGGRLFTIMTCSPAGPCQKYQYVPKKCHGDNSKLCPSFENEIAKKSLSKKIQNLIQKNCTNNENSENTPLLSFFTRGSILSGFLHEYYDQQEEQQVKQVSTVVKKGGKELIYSKEQISWFFSLLSPRILSQQSPDDTLINTHPIYNNVVISSYYGLHNQLVQLAKNENNVTVPQCLLVMPVDKTTDQHMDICGNFFEFSSLLKKFQSPHHSNADKYLYPLQLSIFDVLGNNVNDCLYSYSKFLSSCRLFLSVPKNKPDSLTMTSTAAPSATTTTTKPTTAKAVTGKKPAAALGKVAPAVKKFTLPLVKITSQVPGIDEHTPNDLYAIDLVFDKMIDPSMIEFAQGAGEETPPPTIIEFVTYLAKVQGFLRTALSLGPDWCLVPLMSDQSTFAQEFGNELGKLNGLLDDISYLRMCHSAIIPSCYARFAIQDTALSLEESSEIAKNAAEKDIDSIKMVNFPLDSNEDKLFRALRGFTKRAEVLLGRLPVPVGICPVPYTVDDKASVGSITDSLPQEKMDDWDGDKSKKIPQLMTLMNGIDNTRKFLTQFEQHEFKNDEIIDIKEKMLLLRQGTDSTIELLNDRVRVMIELRDCLLQVAKFIELFPNLTIEIAKNNAKNQNLMTFFTMFQYIYFNTGLVYTLDQAIAHPIISSTISTIQSGLNITTPISIPTPEERKKNKIEPIFHFFDAFSSESPILDKAKLSKLSPPSIPTPLPSKSLFESITTTADLFTKSITSTVHETTQKTFEKLQKTNNYLTIEDETQLQRCLEGYVLLTPQASAASQAKSSFSRAAVQKAANNASKDNINNKKFENAEDRIIVLWITHILDGTFNHIDQMRTVMDDLIAKYSVVHQDDQNCDGKVGEVKKKEEKPQDVVLVRVDIDKYPDILELFALGEPTSLPALLFIQTQAERADLRSTAIEPTEISDLLHAGIISMVDSPELYGFGGFDGDDDEDEFGESEEEGETPE